MKCSVGLGVPQPNKAKKLLIYIGLSRLSLQLGTLRHRGHSAQLDQLDVAEEIVCKVAQSDARGIARAPDVFLFGTAHAVLNTAEYVFDFATNLRFQPVQFLVEIV